MLDLGYLGIEKDFPEQISLHYHIKGKETKQEMSKEEEKDYNKIHSNKKRVRYRIFLQIEKVQPEIRYFGRTGKLSNNE